MRKLYTLIFFIYPFTIAIKLDNISEIAGLLISHQSIIPPRGINTIVIGFVFTPIKNIIISTAAKTVSNNITIGFA